MATCLENKSIGRNRKQPRDMDKSRPDQLPGDVLAALHSGQKIKAIKLLRTTRGLGLKDAKQEVDRFLSHNPQMDRGVEKGSSAFWLIVVAVVLAAAGNFFLTE